jgi:hypothetical protein
MLQRQVGFDPTSSLQGSDLIETAWDDNIGSNESADLIAAMKFTIAYDLVVLSIINLGIGYRDSAEEVR